MKSPWYEVWADDGLKNPYLLLVAFRGDDQPIEVVDPAEGGKVLYSAPDYDAVRLWLLEDEYTRVDGRMERE